MHRDAHGGLQAGVSVGRCPEHDGHLSVHIGLRKGASGLPAWSSEIHFNVLCRRRKGGVAGVLSSPTASTRPLLVLVSSDTPQCCPQGAGRCVESQLPDTYHLGSALSLTSCSRVRPCSMIRTFLYFVTQQEDLIPTKAAPRVSVHPADLELCGVGGA